MSSSWTRKTPIAVSDASDEIWKGRSQFGPHNTGAVDTSHLKFVKAVSHLSVHIKSTFPVKAYKGATIYEKFFINL